MHEFLPSKKLKTEKIVIELVDSFLDEYRDCSVKTKIDSAIVYQTIDGNEITEYYAFYGEPLTEDDLAFAYAYAVCNYNSSDDRMEKVFDVAPRSKIQIVLKDLQMVDKTKEIPVIVISQEKGCIIGFGANAFQKI